MASKVDECGADAIIILFLSGKLPTIFQLTTFKRNLPIGPSFFLFFYRMIVCNFYIFHIFNLLAVCNFNHLLRKEFKIFIVKIYNPENYIKYSY